MTLVGGGVDHLYMYVVYGSSFDSDCKINMYL